MKRISGILLALMITAGLTAGCSNTGGSSTGDAGFGSGSTPQAQLSTGGGAASGAISVVSREDGSGTRSAFIELFGVERKNEAGEKEDYTTVEANVVNSTSVMMTMVAGDLNAIGYISLGSLNDTVKALKIDGVAPSVENIKNESYKIARPFNIATMSTISDVAKDFITYILSADGQGVVETSGYVSTGNAGAYAVSGIEGKIVVAGSSSITPVMEKLKEAYVALNPKVTIEIQQSDSSTGMISTIDGTCDVGMASREVKDSELEKGLSSTTIAMDGIAVIVNKESAVDALSSQNVTDIFTGAQTDWSGIA